MRVLIPGASILLLLLGGCTGTFGNGEEAGRSGPINRPPPLENTLCEVVDVPETPLRHLTREEYDNTVNDLLGNVGSPATSFPGDLVQDGFEVGTNMSPALVESYFDTADGLAQQAVTDLDALLGGCDVAGRGEDACASDFMDSFLLRAFRRPPTAAERQEFTDLFEATVAEQGFSEGIQVVVHATLASSPFLYHYDAPPDGASAEDIVAFSSYAMASKLSYFVWNTMPDDALFAAAAADELRTPDQIATMAREMLQDSRAQSGMKNFYRQWLELDHIDHIELDTDVYPLWNDAMRGEMRESLERYLDYAIWEDGGSFDALFSGDAIFVNESLAEVFGVDASGQDMRRMTAPNGERAGLLTHPALLSAHSHTNQSSPVLRGYFLRTRFFCGSLPPPPPDVVFDLGPPVPGESTRERFSRHSTDESCAGCHNLMDPLGFGLENYDAIGRFRTEDEGVVVDARGEVMGAGEADGPFNGPQELAERMAGSDEVRQCMARQLFRYAAARTERQSEACVLDGLYETAAAQNWSVPEILVAMTQTEPFLFQRVKEGVQ
ncbi:MAG: DUF1592 domain-containing protein [Myxococcota bacterium]